MEPHHVSARSRPIGCSGILSVSVPIINRMAPPTATKPKSMPVAGRVGNVIANETGGSLGDSTQISQSERS